MGYTTEFKGALDFNKTVDDYTVDFVNKFAEIRHMKRDNHKIQKIFRDWERYCYKGSLGVEGEFFIGGTDDRKEPDKSVIDQNTPSKNCPGLWCQWIIRDNQLVWDGGEKFYKYTEWLRYLIENFFAPSGYILNGRIEFQGEDVSDRGWIDVVDNIVTMVNL